MPGRPQLNEELATQLDYFRLLRKMRVINTSEFEREKKKLEKLQSKIDDAERSRAVGRQLREAEDKFNRMRAMKTAVKELRGIDTELFEGKKPNVKTSQGEVTVRFTVWWADAESKEDKAGKMFAEALNILSPTRVERPNRRKDGSRIEVDGIEYKQQRDSITTTVPERAMKGIREQLYTVLNGAQGYKTMSQSILKRLSDASREFNYWFNPLSPKLGFIQFFSISSVPKAAPFNRATVRNTDSEKIAIAYPHFKAETTGSGVPSTWLKRTGEVLQNGCGVMIILNAYREAIEKLVRKREFSKEHLLSSKRVLKICRGDENDLDLSLTLPEFKKFFEFYKLKLSVYDIQQRLLEEYSHNPESPTKKLAPKHLFVLHHNKHLYLLEDTQSLARIQTITVKSEELGQISNSDLKVGDSYHIQDRDPESYLWLNNINDLFAIDFKTCEKIAKNGDVKVLNVFCLCDLAVLVSQLVRDVGYEPAVSMNSGIVTCVRIIVDGVCINIRRPCDNPREPHPQIYNEDEYKVYDNWNNKVYSALVNANTKSYYSFSLMDALNKLSSRPLVGRFTHFIDDNVVAGDFCKAYTSNLMDEKWWLNVSAFDEFVKYEGDDLEPYNLYIVNVEQNSWNEVRDQILFDSNWNMKFGFELIEYGQHYNVKHLIRSVLVPHRLVANIAAEVVGKMWDCTDLTEKQKKDIVNHNIGHTGKCFNTKSSILVFQDYVEARAVAKEKRGKVIDHTINGVKLYFVMKEAKSQLVDGFRLIQEQIYARMRLKLWKAAEGKELLGVKTDCIWVKPFDGFAAGEKPTGKDSIGKIWWFNDSKDALPEKKLDVKTVNDVTPFTMARPEKHIVLKDEFNCDEYAQVFENKSSVFVSGLVPGAGKSYAVERFLKGKNAVCFAPTNVIVAKLRNETGLPCHTVDRLLGMVVGQADKGGIDISEYEYVFIDEFALLTVYRLGKVKKLMEKYPNIKWIAAGDVFQNTPAGEYELNVNAREYYLKCHRAMFKTWIDLQLPKRYITPEQNERILKMNSEMKSLTSQYQRKAFFHKYFKRITKMSEVRGTVITLEDSVARIVDEHFHHREKPEDLYEDCYYVGMKLLCRNNIRISGGRLMKGERYIVEELGEMIKLRDSLGDIWNVPLKEVKKSFRYNFAYTGYSLQGFTIDADWKDGGAITIFNYDHYHANKEWLWTAISRVRNLDEVYFYDGELRPTMTELALKNKIEQRIVSHKRADVAAGRLITDDYIDSSYIQNLLMKCDGRCECQENISEDFSIDRISNELPHVKGNVRLSCLSCNHSGSHK